MPLLPDLGKIEKKKSKAPEVRIAFDVLRRKAKLLEQHLDVEENDFDALGKAAFDYAYNILVEE